MSKTHVVPTHLQTPETILSVGGFDLSVRQFLLLLLGAALSYNLWVHLALLAWLPPVRLGLSVGPALLAVVLAFVRLAGRTLDRWLLTVLLYWQRPHRCVWRSIRFAEPEAMAGLGKEDADAP